MCQTARTITHQKVKFLANIHVYTYFHLLIHTHNIQQLKKISVLEFSYFQRSSSSFGVLLFMKNVFVKKVDCKLACLLLIFKKYYFIIVA